MYFEILILPAMPEVIDIKSIKNSCIFCIHWHDSLSLLLHTMREVSGPKNDQLECGQLMSESSDHFPVFGDDWPKLSTFNGKCGHRVSPTEI